MGCGEAGCGAAGLMGLMVIKGGQVKQGNLLVHNYYHYDFLLTREAAIELELAELYYL